MADDAVKPRWYRLTPDRLLIGLLSVETLLWLAGGREWFPKGWAVLTATATVGVFVALMLIWFAASAIFRWRFQFGIRSIFILVTAVAFISGWLASERERARRQREIIEQVTSRDDGSVARVWYDWHANGKVGSTAQPPAPTLLRSLLGTDFFDSVSGLDLEFAQLTEADVQTINGIGRLRLLYIRNDNITDSMLLALIRTNPTVRAIQLDGDQITDAGIQQLTQLTYLQDLSLGYTQITDRATAYIGTMRQLETLDIHHTRITDAGLERLNHLQRLRWLKLGGKGITNCGKTNLRSELPRCNIQDVD